MRLRELSLRQDPDLRQELAALARGCDFVLPSRFKKRLKAFQQVPGGRPPCVCGGGSLLALPGPCEVGAWGAHTLGVRVCPCGEPGAPCGLGSLLRKVL